jgi:hypothetical protein
VTGQYVSYRTVEQRIVSRKYRPTGHAEDRLGAFVFEALEKRV